ncbi:MAG: hypothetical protein LBG58_07775 [Planctomycetaceae bacterium]|nr:hypothetical protein [Planctomycetaceae bacterium]
MSSSEPQPEGCEKTFGVTIPLSVLDYEVGDLSLKTALKTAAWNTRQSNRHLPTTNAPNDANNDENYFYTNTYKVDFRKTT